MPGKKILVADDSLTIQKVIRLALSNEGYDIQAVSDGNDAIQQIAVFRPDVVLIDVSLPGKSAVEVKRSIDAEPSSAHVRFVLMSSAFERVDEQQIKQLQFHGQLTKPFDPAHLRKVLTDVLATAPAASTQVSPSRGKSENIALVPPPLPEADSSKTEPEMPEELPAMDPLLPPPPTLSPIGLDLPGFEMPPAPSAPSLLPPEINTDDLWGTAPNQPPAHFPTSPAPDLRQDTTPFKPAAAPAPTDDSDIRHLTESTIRMSGLDDFDWSVKEPSLKPGSEISDLSDSNFPFGEPAQDSRHELPPIPGTSIPLSSRDDFSFSGSDNSMNEGLHLGIDSPSNGPHEQEFQGISKEAVEQLIQKEVQAALEKVAQRILPDIAERVIKQEIHRLLSEQP